MRRERNQSAFPLRALKKPPKKKKNGSTKEKRDIEGQKPRKKKSVLNKKNEGEKTAKIGFQAKNNDGGQNRRTILNKIYEGMGVWGGAPLARAYLPVVR